MSTDNTSSALDDPFTFLGFKPGNEIHNAKHSLTLDDLIESLRSDKHDPGKRRSVKLRVSTPQAVLELDVLVRRLTQIYIHYGDGRYDEHPQWAIEGWMLTPVFDPDPQASSVRCYFHGGGGEAVVLGDGSLQFICAPTP